MFSKYFYYCEEYGESLHNNWTSLNKHDFDNWITKCYPSFEKPLVQPISNPPTMKEEEATSMSSNCTDNLASLIYILRILGHDEDSPLTLGLQQAGVNDIEIFTSLPHDFINSMTYPKIIKDINDNNIITNIDVPRMHKLHVKIFQGYISYRNSMNNPIHVNWHPLVKML